MQENPAVGNFEELADLYLDEGEWAKARACYDRAISTRTDHSIRSTGAASPKSSSATSPAAVRDLRARHRARREIRSAPRRRTAGTRLREHETAERADALFRQVTDISTASETYFNYAAFLAAQGRTVEAREWAQKILAKKPTMPRYLQRRERPWFRKANALLKRIGAACTSRQRRNVSGN